MSVLTLPLNQVTTNDAAHAGTKAVALGELQRAEFNVPNGFVLTTPAYAEFIAPLRDQIRAQLTEDVIMDAASIEGAATDIRSQLNSLPFPPALHAALEEALAQLSDGERTSLIARTSRPSDDLSTASGSGVARAYLGLADTGELERAAAKCWAALWNSRSMYYRHRKKIVQTDVALAVLVQPMIRASRAGVMFTENPMTHAQDEMQITSIWGLGAPLTSARFRPDEFLVSKGDGEIRDRTIEEQVVKLVVGEDGHIEEHGIPAAQTETPSLTDAQVKNLALVGKQVEDFFKVPQDIEWAMSGDEIFILQARPVGIRTS